MNDTVITSKRQLPDNYTVIPLAELLPGEQGLARETVSVLHFFVKDADRGRKPMHWILRTEVKEGGSDRRRHSQTMMKLMQHLHREKLNYQICLTPSDIIDYLRDQERERAASKISDEQTDIETYISELIGYAMEHKTADVHITRFENHADVEMRINRRLQHISQITTKRAEELVNCLYATKSINKSGDINLRAPQDADITLTINDETVRLRYSHAPIHPGGWHCTLRLLSGVDIEAGDFRESLIALGYFPLQADAMFRIFKRRYGAFLIAGETGSGKSTTLKIALSTWYTYKEGTINILTAEDPPEYVIHGAKQTPVNKSGKGVAEGHDPFLSVFRSMMRRDGDILMPGEIREASSVNAFAEATLSGHKVVASIHASSAMGIIPRLYNIGTKCKENPVDRNTLSNPNFLSGFAYQQLVPLNCSHCCLTLKDGLKKGYVEEDCYERLCAVVNRKHHAGIRVRNHQGCNKCNNTGLRGVISCAEVAEIDSTIREYIGASKDFDADRYWRGLANKLEPEGWADARNNKHGLCAMDVAITRVIMGELDPMEAENACDLLSSPRPEKITAKVVALKSHKMIAEEPIVATLPEPEQAVEQEQEETVLEAVQAPATESVDEDQPAAESAEKVQTDEMGADAPVAEEVGAADVEEAIEAEMLSEADVKEVVDVVEEPMEAVAVEVAEGSDEAPAQEPAVVVAEVDDQEPPVDAIANVVAEEEEEEPAAHLAVLNNLVDQEYRFDDELIDDEEGVVEAAQASEEEQVGSEIAADPAPTTLGSTQLMSGYSCSSNIIFGHSWPGMIPSGMGVNSKKPTDPVTEPDQGLLDQLDSIEGAKTVSEVPGNE